MANWRFIKIRSTMVCSKNLRCYLVIKNNYMTGADFAIYQLHRIPRLNTKRKLFIRIYRVISYRSIREINKIQVDARKRERRRIPDR